MKLKYLQLLLAFLTLSVVVTSCSDSEEEQLTEIVGSWYGTYSYYNPVGGTKYQYLTIRFNENNTGELEYEGPVSYSVAKFFYTYSDNTIKCNGAYADTNGDMSENFVMTLTKKGDRLYPQDKFTNFILTQDNSVLTKGDGEIIDKNHPEEEEKPTDTTDPNLQNLVNNHLTVNAEYSDYAWRFTIESTLHTALPGKDIKYGIGHGTLSDGNEYISVENDAYKYSSRMSGSKKIMEFTIPFWFYYWLGSGDNGDTAAKGEMYYASYLALKEKGYNTLSSDEKALFNELTKYLNGYESAADWNYQPAVYVYIDSKFYLFKRYKRK